MPIIVTVCGRKGGPGKTTLVIAIGVELHRRGVRVLLVDADNEDGEGTLCWWQSRAAAAGHWAGVVTVGDDIRTRLPELAAGYDVVIIDTPGATEERTVFALCMSHVALMPCSPSPPDVWKLGTTVDQVRKVQADFPRLAAAIVAVKVDRGTVLGREAREVLLGAKVPVLRTQLSDSVGYKYPLAAGQGPTTWHAAGVPSLEMKRLTAELGRAYRIGVKRAK